MKTIYLNTASKETTIALFEGDQVVDEKRWPAEQNESELLQPAVDELLKKNELTPDDIGRLVVCVGPGGFTSTRVGVSAANAWAFAKQVPVAQVSLFDLYDTEQVIVISANRSQAWVKEPGKDPIFVDQESAELPESFSFTGILDGDWLEFLKERGGEYVEQSEQLPDVSLLEFKDEIIKPWYYKDPNITWSHKNKKN